MKKQKLYTDQELSRAVDRVLAGEGPTAVAKDTNVPVRTISKYVKMRRDGTPIVHTRRGPPPMLTVDSEADLVTWTHGTEQRHSCLPFRDSHAREQGGNPADYTDRVARKKRLLAAEAGAAVPNSPESGHRRRHRRYSDLQYGRDELYGKEKERPCRCASRLPKRLDQVNRPNFRLSVAACGNASGHVIPPLFILPGQRLSRHIMSERNISGVRATSTATGLVNRAVFVKWVQFFSNSVPPTVKQPLLLLFDRYLSHLSRELIQAGETLGIRFVCLPANATHLVQPMDIAVFSSYKKNIRSLVWNYMFDSSTLSHIYSPNSKTRTYHGEIYTGSCRIDKSTAIRLV